MVIDIIFFGLMVIAIFKGINRGLIIAIFSVIAMFVGLAAALKLSSVVAAYMETQTKISGVWLPVFSFILVMIISIMLVRWVGKILEKTVKLAMLGWLNRLGGIVLYILLYCMIYSILLFFANQTGLLKEEVVNDSIIYRWLEPLAPAIMDSFGRIIPFFRDMFTTLEDFFEGLSSGL
ncbi:MAG TPA: CvpA family protein [Parasegetibacter sp.]